MLKCVAAVAVAGVTTIGVGLSSHSRDKNDKAAAARAILRRRFECRQLPEFIRDANAPIKFAQALREMEVCRVIIPWNGATKTNSRWGSLDYVTAKLISLDGAQTNTASITYRTGDGVAQFPNSGNPVDNWVGRALGLWSLRGALWTEFLPSGHNVLYVMDPEASITPEITQEFLRMCFDAPREGSYLTVVVLQG